MLTADVSSSARETLALIEESGEETGVSIPDLTELSGQAKSTVTRHVSQLAANEVVVTWQDGKTKFARTTLTGRLLLRVA